MNRIQSALRGPVFCFQRGMRRLTPLCLLFFLLLPLMGCGETELPMSDYLTSALDAEVTAVFGEASYLVTLHLGSSSEDGTRDAEITVLTPGSIEGLTFRVRNGETVLSDGESEVPYLRGEVGGIFSLVGFFAPCTVIGRETAVCGETPCVLLRAADGRCFYVLPSTGELLAIEAPDCRVTVEWIEVRRKAET